MSDILHNSVRTARLAQLTLQSSSLPNVWRYRQSFESRLPAVFEHFATIHSRLLEYSGTLSANVFIQQVDAVLDIWERWWVEAVVRVLTARMVLTSEIQGQLRRLLHGECTLASLAEPQAPTEPEPDAKPVVKSAGFKSSFKRVDPFAAAPSPVPAAALVTEELDGEPVEDLDGEPVEDLDGEPVGDVDGGHAADVDGEPIDNIDGEPADDVDSEPVDDVDGEPVDDADGEDMDMDMDDDE